MRRPRARPRRGSRRAAADRPRRLSYRERQELEAIEARIQEAESERAFLEASLSDPSLYSDSPERVPALSAALDAADRRVDALYARWAELEAIRDAS